ncbi:hypothetical protein [Coleofasciculus sp. FACHB-129]|uniref:hypothetical protein n=1 Tax=Coleofasciculus sp. FACHB-129 TaxID=2692785 RepID=UPI0019913EC3|nr:hypothetical protein [Coleofasciculus sp. FACHB-129]MBD1897549.1 hypothetical protein [Coleofasciculus sp. FACHB-129]
MSDRFLVGFLRALSVFYNTGKQEVAGDRSRQNPDFPEAIAHSKYGFSKAFGSFVTEC